jgi:capsular polysaccharide transport system permease protein
MAAPSDGVRRFAGEISKHGRILWALLLREFATRYGRDNIGFLWVIAEPLIFAGGIGTVWSIIRPPYEHGLKLVPFLMTGYMPLIMVRQVANYSVNAVRSNQALLYHRQITPLHMFAARIGLEFIGVSLAACLTFFALYLTGTMRPPRDFLDVRLIFGGWFLLGWLAASIALVMGALSAIFEFVERFTQIITYVMIPLSGCFFMAAWMPPKIRDIMMMLPFIHGWELMRSGFFGRFVTTYYNLQIAVAWCAGLTLLGLFLLQYVRESIEVE